MIVDSFRPLQVTLCEGLVGWFNLVAYTYSRAYIIGTVQSVLLYVPVVDRLGPYQLVFEYIWLEAPVFSTSNIWGSHKECQPPSRETGRRGPRRMGSGVG
jgi:hypothetical protein